jgi:hypothetical protein
MAPVRTAVVLAVVVFACAVSAAASGAPALSVIKSFRTPSGNIGCTYFSGGAPGQSHASLRCDIRSGFKPQPTRPKNCHLDYGDSYELGKTGRTILVCHGDTAIDPHARVLAYGKVWHYDGFTCTSKSAGLRCTNRSGHGFFISRGHSYRF